MTIASVKTHFPQSDVPCQRKIGFKEKRQTELWEAEHGGWVQGRKVAWCWDDRIKTSFDMKGK